MKLVGFSIAKDCIAVERGADYFDLHNNFDFQELSYNPVQRSLELTWRRGDGDWISPTDPAELCLSFEDVYFFKATERDPEIPYTEDDCLNFIGFIWDESINEMDAFASNEPQAGCTHLIANFMSGFSVKLGASLATLTTSN